jgi:hypothetical protein
MSPTTRLVTRTDLPIVEQVLARAFRDDPMITWLVDEADPDRRMRASIDGFFAISAEAGRRRGHAYLSTDGDDAVAAAVWSPPDVSIFGEDEAVALGGAMVGVCGDEALGRLMALGELVERHHPHHAPHFYLFLLGASVPGRGAGAAALTPVLDRCDTERWPAYLESSSARNLDFYRRLGFEVIWEEAPEGGPMMRGLWREPSTGVANLPA